MLSQAALEIMDESRAEGMVQGISRGKADLLLRLMRRRFDDIPPAVEQRIRSRGEAQAPRLLAQTPFIPRQL
jgi:hypothetical protein